MQTNEVAVRERKRRAHRSRSEWLEEAKKWRATGKSAEEYAEEHDLSARTLTWWASRLRVGRQRSKKKGIESAAASRTPRFLPVRIVEHAPAAGDANSPTETPSRSAVEPKVGPRPLLAPPHAAGCEIEVVLLNGRRVRFGAGMDETVLARVLKIAEEGGI